MRGEDEMRVRKVHDRHLVANMSHCCGKRETQVHCTGRPGSQSRFIHLIRQDFCGFDLVHIWLLKKVKYSVQKSLEELCNEPGRCEVNYVLLILWTKFMAFVAWAAWCFLSYNG